jgi:hypothetical protein
MKKTLSIAMTFVFGAGAYGFFADVVSSYGVRIYGD